MFDRKKYKSFARIQLKNRRTVPALMTLITALVLLLLSLPLIKRSITMYSEILQAAVLSANRNALMKGALESGVVTIEDIGDINGEHYGKK